MWKIWGDENEHQNKLLEFPVTWSIDVWGFFGGWFICCFASRRSISLSVESNLTTVWCLSAAVLCTRRWLTGEMELEWNCQLFKRRREGFCVFRDSARRDLGKIEMIHNLLTFRIRCSLSTVDRQIVCCEEKGGASKIHKIVQVDVAWWWQQRKNNDSEIYLPEYEWRWMDGNVQTGESENRRQSRETENSIKSSQSVQ
jgi:hypothetical protein